jgi:hypothetical protein
MNNKTHCSLCNLTFKCQAKLRIHCETARHKKACESPTETNNDNIILKQQQDIDCLNRKVDILTNNVQEMMQMLTQIMNQTKPRVKSQECVPEKQPEGLGFNDVIMTDLIEGLGEYKINKVLKDPENSEGLFDLNPEAISDEHGHRRWTELFCNLKKETNYDGQLQLCSEFVLDHFSSEEDFFIECENPPRLRFIKGVGDKKQWESKEHSKSSFDKNLNLIIDLIQRMDEQYGKFMKHHNKPFEPLDVHDVINEGFSVDYLYDKLIQKEF